MNLLKKITVFAEQHVSKRQDGPQGYAQPCYPYTSMYENRSERERDVVTSHPQILHRPPDAYIWSTKMARGLK